MEMIQNLLNQYGSGILIVGAVFGWLYIVRRIGDLGAQLGTRLDKIETRLDRLEEKVSSIDSRLAVLEEREGILRKDVDKLKESQRRTEDRVLQIETFNAAAPQGYGRAAMGGA